MHFSASSFSKRCSAFFSTRTGSFVEYLMLAVSGSVYSLIFARPGYSVLAWVGIMPLFFLSIGHSPLPALLRGFVWGYFWSLFSFMWLREIMFFIPFLLSGVLGMFPSVWAVFSAWLFRNLAYSPSERLKGYEFRNGNAPFRGAWRGSVFLFSSAAFWVCTEWVRSWILTGLPWNFLGASQWKCSALIQISEYTGVYGISFLVILINLAVALGGIHYFYVFKERKYARPVPLMLAFFLLCAAMFFGHSLFLRSAKKSGETVQIPIGVLQTNLSQRRFGGYQSSREALDLCLNLSEELLKSPGPKPRVIIWPETAVPQAYLGGGLASADYRNGIGSLLQRYQTPFLVGSLDFELLDNQKFNILNSALLLTRPDGSVADRYSKIHRVPFGEYVPFGNEFPILNRMVGMGRNLTPGKTFRILNPTPGLKIGTSICFESVFPEISRGHAKNGANALLVITNDAWYPSSWEPDQHFANAVFRAVETRLPMIRCANGGASALISPRGEVLRTMIRPDRETFSPAIRGNQARIFDVTVFKNPVPTFYTTYGNLFVLLCGFLSFFGSLVAFSEWRMFRIAQADDSFYSAKTFEKHGI